MLYANELNFTARVNTNRLNLNSYLTYEVVISGSDLNGLPELTLPDFGGKFDVVSSSKQTSFTFVNGEVSNSEIRKFSLLPSQTGDLIIGPASIKFKGKTYRSNSIKVTVLPPEEAQSNQNQAPQSSTSQAQQSGNTNTVSPPATTQLGNIFADASLSKESVYVGEQVVFNLRLFRRLRLFSDIAFEVPDFNGFWIEPLTISKEEKLDNSTGRRFHVRELDKKALFPLKPGALEIPASRVGVVVNMFEGQKVLNSNPLTLTVKPLPEEGKPSQFSGLVGEFTIAGKLNQNMVTQNNSITYTIVLTGNGNIRSVEDIQFKPSDQFKIYRAKVEDQLNNDTVISGKRIFNYIIIPKEAGKLMVPEFGISFFSPQDEQYKDLRLAQEEITVFAASTATQIQSESYLPQAQKVQVLEQDLRYLKTPLDIHKTYKDLRENIIFSVLFYGNLLLALVLVLGIVKRFYWKTDTNSLRSKRAYTKALKALDKLDKANIKTYLSQSQTIFLEFLSDKVSSSLLGKTHAEIKAVLSEKSLSEQEIDAVLGILEKLSFLAYAPDAEREAQLNQVELEIKAVFDQLKEAL